MLIYVMCGNQSNRNRNSIELNRNRIMIIGGEEIARDIDDCMLDIVVGIKSNLNRKLYRIATLDRKSVV